MLSKIKNKLPLGYKGITRKIITATILFSSIITFVITAFNLYDRYQYDVSRIDSQFKQIKDVHLSSLTNNLWLTDKPELEVQLSGILKIADIQYLEVYDTDKLWASAGTKKDSNIKSQYFPLVYNYKDKPINIGKLLIIANLDGVYDNVYQGLWMTLVTNGVKTFLVAFFMFFLFYNLVIRHLYKIASDVTKFDINKTDHLLQLEREGNKLGEEDEFDLVINSFRKLQKDLKLSFSSIEEQVELRTKELVAATEEAVNANSVKTDFLSRMSHELRTPMNAILGFSQLLELDESLSQSHKESIGEILLAGDHLLELINEVLDLSRIESGTLELTLVPVNISYVVNDSLSLIEPLLKERNIKVVWDSGNQTQYIIQAETNRLKQIIINLLSNAIKYNTENGKITINVVKYDNRLRLNIIDTGPGLSAEQQEQVFEPFNRAGAETTNTEGTGIGLTISKRLVELMGGEIGVESSLGNGSCFYIKFKLLEINT